MREILPVSGRTLDGLLHGSTVVRMGTLNDHVDGDRRSLVVSKDPESLIRPNDFAGGDAPAEAAGAAQSLRFGQIGLAVSQVLLSSLAWLDVDIRTEVPDEIR